MLMLDANDYRHARFALSPNGKRQPARTGNNAGPQYRQTRVDPVFLALYPDAIASQSAVRLAYHVRDKYRLKAMPLGRHRSHITLHGFGEYAALTEAMVRAIGDSVMRIGMPPFVVGLDYVERFRNGAVVLRGDDGVAGVAMFHDALVRGLEQRGIAMPTNRPFTPHLTLLYDPGHVPIQAVEEVRWTVHECVLAHSPQGESRHIPIARWRLAGRPVTGAPCQVVDLVAAHGRV
jgi:2'-5' RNA ligase